MIEVTMEHIRQACALLTKATERSDTSFASREWHDEMNEVAGLATDGNDAAVFIRKESQRQGVLYSRATRAIFEAGADGGLQIGVLAARIAAGEIDGDTGGTILIG
jgi:hypothetical protein